MRRVPNRILALLAVVLASIAPQPAAVRADVVAAYELTDPAVVPGGGVVAVTQGAPGQPLEITLDNTPGDHTIKILFAADVDVATALYGYAIELTTEADTVEATALDYRGPFDFDFPADFFAGPGTLVDEASQGTFSPQSGMMDLFEFTLVVSVPTAEIQISSVIGDNEWASTADPFTITIGDSDPLDNTPAGQVTSTPSIIIRTFVAPPVDCNTNTIPDADEIAAQPILDCNTSGTLDSCEIAGGAADCNANGVLDSCEPAAGATDCNANGILDSCDLSAGAADCDANGVPDSCDLAAGTSTDCDWNGVLDRCEIASGAALDCNTNGRPDRCDVAGGQSADSNTNGVPDECESVASAQEQTQDQDGQPSRVVDRQSLRSYLAILFGIPGEGGLSLSDLPVSFLGPLGIPLSILLEGLEIMNYPTRIVIFEFSYALLDALLP